MKMLKEIEAKRLIVREWEIWDEKAGTESDKHAFYDWLKEHRPDLLHFKTNADKWIVIELWLRGKR